MIVLDNPNVDWHDADHLSVVVTLATFPTTGQIQQCSMRALCRWRIFVKPGSSTKSESPRGAMVCHGGRRLNNRSVLHRWEHCRTFMYDQKHHCGTNLMKPVNNHKFDGTRNG